MIAALLLEMIRYKLAWLLYIYQRVLCVKWAIWVNGRISYGQVDWSSHAPKKKLKFWPLGLLFDMLSRDSAAITLRVCHVYIEEGCYEVHVGLEVNLRGLVRWIVDFWHSPKSLCKWGGSSILLYKFSNSHCKHIHLTQNFATNPSVVVTFPQCQ